MLRPTFECGLQSWKYGNIARFARNVSETRFTFLCYDVISHERELLLVIFSQLCRSTFLSSVSAFSSCYDSVVCNSNSLCPVPSNVAMQLLRIASISFLKTINKCGLTFRDLLELTALCRVVRDSYGPLRCRILIFLFISISSRADISEANSISICLAKVIIIN